MKFEKMKFNADNFEVIMNDSSYMVLSIDVVSDGINRHGTEFKTEDIIKSIPKIANKPLNCLFTSDNSDFEAHAWTERELEAQVAVGTIPETNKAEMVEKNGANFLRVNAIIWKYLFPQAEEILKRRKEVAISMEIDPLDGYELDNGVVVITDWNYEAVTLLGYNVTPAIPNASATVKKFSSKEKYIEAVEMKYNVLMDSYSVPNNIIDNIKTELGTVQTNPNVITEALDVLDRDNLNYSEIIALKQKILSLDEGSQSLLSGKEFLKWTSAIEKERNGGTENLDKLKDMLIEKFGSNLKYESHDDTTVFCFDYDTAQFKGFKYTYEEVEDKYSVEIEADFMIYVRLTGSDALKALELIGEEDEVEDSLMYSISAYSDIKSEIALKDEEITTFTAKVAELEGQEEAYKEKESKFASDLESVNVKNASLEKELIEIKDKVLEYASLDEELTGLRTYKQEKEKSEKMEKVNELYAKYAEFLTEEETNKLNEKVDLMEISDFTKEVYGIVTPKMEAKVDSLVKLQNLDDKKTGKDSLEFNIIDVIGKNDVEQNKPQSLIERLKSV